MPSKLFSQHNAQKNAGKQPSMQEIMAQFQRNYGCSPSQHLQQLLQSGQMPQDFYTRAMQQAQMQAGVLSRFLRR